MTRQPKPTGESEDPGGDLTARERGVLEAVVRSYVTTAEPTGSRSIAKGYELGVSAATIRNTMSDLEDKGYLLHPHTSAGRVPTDLAYRYFVDRIIRPVLTAEERSRVERELDSAGGSAIDRLVSQAARALGLLTQELGVAIVPRIGDATLEKLELIQVSSSKILLVATIASGLVRTVYVDLVAEVPEDTLIRLTVALNERLAGLTLSQVRESLPARLKDLGSEGTGAQEFLNIFVQSGPDVFDWSAFEGPPVHMGQTSVLATQPEFHSGERLKGLIELTERTDFISEVLSARSHPGGLRITIGSENGPDELSDFALVTAEYRVGNLKGVVGVIGPTRMPYDRVIAIVDYTSTLVNKILKS